MRYGHGLGGGRCRLNLSMFWLTISVGKIWSVQSVLEFNAIKKNLRIMSDIERVFWIVRFRMASRVFLKVPESACSAFLYRAQDSSWQVTHQSPSWWEETSLPHHSHPHADNLGTTRSPDDNRWSAPTRSDKRCCEKGSGYSLPHWEASKGLVS